MRQQLLLLLLLAVLLALVESRQSSIIQQRNNNNNNKSDNNNNNAVLLVESDENVKYYHHNVRRRRERQQEQQQQQQEQQQQQQQRHRRRRDQTATSTNSASNPSPPPSPPVNLVNRYLDFVMIYSYGFGSSTLSSSPSVEHMMQLQTTTEIWLLNSMKDPRKYCNIVSVSLTIGDAVVSDRVIQVPMRAMLSYDNSAGTVPTKNKLSYYLYNIDTQPYIRQYIWELDDITNPFWHTDLILLSIQPTGQPPSPEDVDDGPPCAHNRLATRSGGNNNQNKGGGNNSNNNNNNINNSGATGNNGNSLFTPAVMPLLLMPGDTVDISGQLGFGWLKEDAPIGLPNVDIDLNRKLKPWLDHYMTSVLKSEYGMDYISTNTIIDIDKGNNGNNNDNDNDNDNGDISINNDVITHHIGQEYDTITVKVSFSNLFVDNANYVPTDTELYYFMRDLEFSDFVMDYLWSDDPDNGYWYWIVQLSWST